MMKKIAIGMLVLLTAAFAGCGGSGGGSVDGSASVVSTVAVVPSEPDEFKAGNAAAECAQAGIYQYAFKIDNWSVAVDGPYQADFSDGHSNAITIANNDGTTFDWSAAPNRIGAVIVKGGPNANIFNYDPQASSDTGLYSPVNNGGKVPEVSHVTFCWNPEGEVCFKEESAWSAGTRYVSKGNWATFTPYSAGTVKLFAGQIMEAGTVTFSAVEAGKVTITIQLNEGWSFNSEKEENVKIQGYNAAPLGNPSPGQFANKFTEAGTFFSAVVDVASYYGVHVDVRKQVECVE
jgi:hypothetical protein